jgi:abortive infection bacteriophage resistance protein
MNEILHHIFASLKAENKTKMIRKHTYQLPKFGQWLNRVGSVFGAIRNTKNCRD